MRATSFHHGLPQPSEAQRGNTEARLGVRRWRTGDELGPEVPEHRLPRRAIESALEDSNGQRSIFSLLTRREAQVLGLVAEGITSGEIGERLGIGTRTVETHRAHIMRKLGLRSHLISFAVRHNLLARPPASNRAR